MNKGEEAFADMHQRMTGHALIYQPATFRFPDEARVLNYRPDFYCTQCGIFFEVSATRQAFHQDKCKLRALGSYYPQILIKVVRPDGSDYRAIVPDLRYRNGKDVPAVLAERKDISFRREVAEHLKRYVGTSVERLGEVSHGSRVYAQGIIAYLKGIRTPNSRTARMIHDYLTRASVEDLTAHGEERCAIQINQSRTA